METSNTENNKRSWTRFKRKKTLVASSALIAILAVVVFLSYSLHGHEQPTGNIVSFLVRIASSNRTFIIDVEADLTDGLSEGEAITVGSKAFDKAIEGYQEFRLAHCSDALAVGFDIEAFAVDKETWMVRLHLVHVNSDYESFGRLQLPTARNRGIRLVHEFFNELINQSNQTVVCYTSRS